MDNKLGQYIANYRKENSLTLREFASKCQMSHTYISKLEKGIDVRSGKQVVPTIETFQLIAKGTDIDLENLLNICGFGSNPKHNNNIIYETKLSQTINLLLEEKGILNPGEDLTDEQIDWLRHIVDKALDIANPSTKGFTTNKNK